VVVPSGFALCLLFSLELVPSILIASLVSQALATELPTKTIYISREGAIRSRSIDASGQQLPITRAQLPGTSGKGAALRRNLIGSGIHRLNQLGILQLNILAFDLQARRDLIRRGFRVDHVVQDAKGFYRLPAV
jgi:hypothetical protein